MTLKKKSSSTPKRSKASSKKTSKSSASNYDPRIKKLPTSEIKTVLREADKKASSSSKVTIEVTLEFEMNKTTWNSLLEHCLLMMSEESKVKYDGIEYFVMDLEETTSPSKVQCRLK